MAMINVSVVLIYIALFVWQCYHHQVRRWLWVSLLTWSMTGLISAWFMPGVLGIGHIINLYWVHFYVFLGSITYIGSKHLRPNEAGYLYYLARSSWLQYLALGVWGILNLLLGCPAWLIRIDSSLLQMILLQPVFWLGSQWILMAYLYVRDRDSTLLASHRRQSLLTSVILWQAVYVFADIFNLI